MTIITPKDAFALALIAQRPKDNKDLLATLSPSARPIGMGLAGGAKNQDVEVERAVKQLKKWATLKPRSKAAKAASGSGS